MLVTTAMTLLKMLILMELVMWMLVTTAKVVIKIVIIMPMMLLVVVIMLALMCLIYTYMEYVSTTLLLARREAFKRYFVGKWVEDIIGRGWAPSSKPPHDQLPRITLHRFSLHHILVFLGPRFDELLEYFRRALAIHGCEIGLQNFPNILAIHHISMS